MKLNRCFLPSTLCTLFNILINVLACPYPVLCNCVIITFCIFPACQERCAIEFALSNPQSPKMCILVDSNAIGTANSSINSLFHKACRKGAILGGTGAIQMY